MNYTLRLAEEKDVPTILHLIKELAIYEKLLDEVVATEEILIDSLFKKKAAEVVLCEVDGIAVGYALFFTSFSTFLGRAGIYLEDLFIVPEMRKKGLGKALLSFLAKTAKERNCGRLEWSCLDWNKPSIDFYLSLGAKPMNGWTVYRVTGDALTDLANK